MALSPTANGCTCARTSTCLRHLGLTLSDASYYEQYLGYDDVGVLRCYAKDHAARLGRGDHSPAHRGQEPPLRELTARGEMIFPGAARFIREAARRVPIAIASGALTHEIDEILERTQLRSPVSRRRRRRPVESDEALARAISRSRSRGSRRRTARIDRVADRRDRRLALGPRIGAGRRAAPGRSHQYLSAEHELSPHAELVVSGLDRLTLDALDALCATPPQAFSVTTREARRP